MKNKEKIRQIVFLIISFFIMIAIFWFSSKNATESDSQSSEIVNVIFNKVLKKAVPVDANHIIRKMAHFSIYLLLGISIFFATKKKKISFIINTCFCQAFCMLYSISDEIHQIFVPGRAFSFFDIFIDSLGAFIGILIALLIIKISNKKG